MQKPDIPAAIKTIMGPVQGEPLEETVGQLIDSSKNRNQDILRDINTFITSVLRFAGFDFGSKSGDLDFKNRDARLINYFTGVDPQDVLPGDLISFVSSGTQNLGLIESFNPETMTGTMYGSVGLEKNVTSTNFGREDLENEASIMRPLMQFFMGNIAGIDAMDNYDEDSYEEMRMSSYPSPSPY